MITNLDERLDSAILHERLVQLVQARRAALYGSHRQAHTSDRFSQPPDVWSHRYHAHLHDGGQVRRVELSAADLGAINVLSPVGVDG